VSWKSFDTAKFVLFTLCLREAVCNSTRGRKVLTRTDRILVEPLRGI